MKKFSKLILTTLIAFSLFFLFSMTTSAWAFAENESSNFVRIYASPFNNAWWAGNEIKNTIQTSDNGYVAVGLVHGAENGSYCQTASIIKFKENGSIEWNKIFNKTDLSTNTVFAGVEELNDGSLIAVGYSNCKAVANDGAHNDVFVVKLDKNGTILWQKAYGKSTVKENVWATAVTENNDQTITIIGAIYRDGAGDYYGGYYWGYGSSFSLTINGNGDIVKEFNLSESSHAPTNVLYSDKGYLYSYDRPIIARTNIGWTTVLKKYDINGKMSWSSTYYLTDDTVDKATFKSVDTDMSLTNTKIVEVDDGYIIACTATLKLFVYKIDMSGKVLWGKLLSYQNGGMGGMHVWVDNIMKTQKDGVIITTTNGMSTIGLTTVKLENDGDVESINNYGGTYLHKLVSDGDNNYFATGGNLIALLNEDGSLGFDCPKLKVTKVTEYTSDPFKVNVIDGQQDGIGLGYLTNFTSAPVNLAYNDTFKDNLVYPQFPNLQCDNKDLVFENLPVNSTSQPKATSITNKGDGDLVIGDIKIIGANIADFKLSAPITANTVIKKDGTIKVDVLFKPTSSGKKSATLLITTNDPKQKEVKVELAGTGNPVSNGVVIAVAPASLNFGSLAVKSTSQNKTIQIKSTGKNNLKIKGISITGTNAKDFVIIAKTAVNKVVPPSKSVAFTVKFAPKSKGTKNASITILSNDNISSKVKIQLSGLGK